MEDYKIIVKKEDEVIVSLEKKFGNNSFADFYLKGMIEACKKYEDGVISGNYINLTREKEIQLLP